MPDLSKLSDDDLDALETGNLAGVSDAGLNHLELLYGKRTAPGLTRSGDGVPGPSSGRMESFKAGFRAVPPVLKAVTLPFEQGQAGMKQGVEQGLGEGGPAALGAIAGGVALSRLGVPPGVGGALLSSAFTGGGAAVGETIREAAQEEGFEGETIIRRGMEIALTDLGVSAGVGAVRGVLPIAAQVFLKTPAESIKRAFKKPQLIMLGQKAKANIQRIGARAIDEVQTAVESTRKTAGEAVDAALAALDRSTGGKRIINAEEVIADGMDVLNKSGAFDPLAGTQLESEVKFLEGLIDKMPAGGRITAVEAVNLRRRLDDLITFRPGGIVKVTSDVHERMAQAMAKKLKGSIDTAATVYGDDGLKDANSHFHRVATVYNEMGEIFRTSSDSMLQRLGKFDKASRMFYSGGLPQEILEEVATQIPIAKNAIEDLLDASAGMSFTEIPAGSPSSMLFNLFRLFSSPPAVGIGIKTMEGRTGLVRSGFLSATSILDGLIFRKERGQGPRKAAAPERSEPQKTVAPERQEPRKAVPERQEPRPKPKPHKSHDKRESRTMEPRRTLGEKFASRRLGRGAAVAAFLSMEEDQQRLLDKKHGKE